ncbi:hypothetical protein [Microvirga sp. P5_D2]
MLFVTLHGGKPQTDPHKNNVHAHDKDGKRITPSVLRDSGAILLDELRGIYLVGKYLYVVNSNRQENSVLCYKGAGARYKLVSTFVSKQSCKGIEHPFDIAFDDAGYCYVSSQDTNIVTRLIISADGTSATPAPQAPALPASGTFYPGTFVASSVDNLGSTTTPMKTPAGLEYFDSGKNKHSVRGVVWANNALYVADEPAGRVKAYDKNGQFMGQSNGIKSPVHMTVRKGNLYVSAGNDVLTAKLPSSPGDFTLSPIEGVKVKKACGMAFTKSGHFYIASRSEKIILKFDSDFKPMKFACKLADNPEFLLHV